MNKTSQSRQVNQMNYRYLNLFPLVIIFETMNKTSIFVKESLMDTLQISKTILMTMELY